MEPMQSTARRTAVQAIGSAARVVERKMADLAKRTRALDDIACPKRRRAAEIALDDERRSLDEQRAITDRVRRRAIAHA